VADTVRIGLNGFGHIGRSFALRDDRVKTVGSNDAIDDENVAYLAKYDTVMGTLGAGNRPQ
jgi:glyceraldehyde 3-phosphate dehydrogenase